MTGQIEVRATDRPTVPRVDCLVVGGGPGGLTAALYLARYRLSVIVVDRGGGRAASIPRTRNYPGFPEGIGGSELVSRISEQAARHGVRVLPGTVHSLRRTGGGFLCGTDVGTVKARAVILATGIADVRPPIANALHDAALAAGAIRYCPICDGFEVVGRRVGVLGRGAHAAREARFIRSFTDDVTILSWDGDTGLDAEARTDLARSGIAVLDNRATGARLDGARLVVETEQGDVPFDAVYPALGASIGSRLALDLGAACDPEGYLLIDEHQRTAVPGLYAVGDVVAGLNQISRATGQAATAATAVRNDLFGGRRPCPGADGPDAAASERPWAERSEKSVQDAHPVSGE